MTEASERVQPYYCPYCGDEDFVPAPDEGVRGSSSPPDRSGGDQAANPPAGWGTARRAEPARGFIEPGFHCKSCDRRFVVRFLGLGAPVPVLPEGG